MPRPYDFECARRQVNPPSHHAELVALRYRRVPTVERQSMVISHATAVPPSSPGTAVQCASMVVDGEALRDALEKTAADHGPGVYGLVTEAGRTVFAGAVGVADLADRRPIDGGDRYRIGSVT